MRKCILLRVSGFNDFRNLRLNRLYSIYSCLVVKQDLRRLMIFLKSLAGGLAAAIAAWIAIITIYMRQLALLNRRQGGSGLIAVAGGWDSLLGKPMTAVLLAAAFGVGVYLTARWAVGS
jgi:hypothetical protein